MASPAFRGPAEYLHLIFAAQLRNMGRGDKIFMNMATLAIFIDHPVVLFLGEIAVKRFLDLFGVATRKDQPKRKNGY